MTNRSLDKNGRWRAKTISFRASEEEIASINDMVKFSGITKQQYILNKLLNKDIIIKGNPRVHYALKKEIDKLYTCIDSKKFTESDIENLEIILQIISDFKKEMD